MFSTDNWTNGSTIDTGLGGTVDTVIALHGRVRESGGNSYPFPYAGTSGYAISAYFRYDGFIIKTGSSNTINDATVILEYTKTTD